MESAFESDDTIAFRLAVHRVELARGLDRALHRLGARIGEKHIVGKAFGAKPVGELLLLGYPEQIGDMDRLVCLARDRVGDLWMRVAERIHRNPGGEVEIALAIEG